MTPEQKKWLDEHPNYSPVREHQIVGTTGWTDRGWLFHNGRFFLDDGQTLFPHKYPAWFAWRGSRPMLVGRHFTVV